jgi:hypothetical protein
MRYYGTRIRFGPEILAHHPCVTLSEGKKNHTKAEETPMASFADGPGPGTFDEAQAHAYAAATDIETAFPHDQVFVEILRHHARGAALDL